jgi:hypothetical protein
VEKKMRVLRVILIAAGLVSLLVISPRRASARSRFYIGFGTSIGHGHSILHRGHFPYYGLHGGYYGWLDHDRYRWMDRGRFRSSFWGWPSRPSGISIWVDDCWPVWVAPPVIVGAPRVITRRHVVVKPKQYESKPQYNPDTAKLYAKLRNKKSELLKTLKIGDKANRIKAIAELAGYSFDDNVRKALEEILLKDPDPELRRQVAESLGKVKNRKVIPTLEKARVEDSDEGVRAEADQAIKKIRAY